MAVALEKIIRISAQTRGQQGLVEMDRMIRRLGPGAEASVTGVLRLNQTLGIATQQVNRLAGASGLLSNAFGALAPVASIAGLTTLVKTQIEAGDSMNDLSQRYGVAVEQLARFDKAARLSGTTLETVGKSLGKLSKGLYEAKTEGKGSVNDALNTLGITATDATGKLKTADQVVLEVANKFKDMPDGVEKTAIAMQLFGKAGAEMIPMLNEGGDSLEKMSVKMTQAFATKADEYNDKLTTLSGKVSGLARGLTVALLPALTGLTDGLTFIVDLFSKLPEPVQAVIGGATLLAIAFTALAIPISTLLPLFTALSKIQLAATFAGWAGAIGPAVGAITTALTGLLTWMATTFVPAMVAFFSGPVGWIALGVAALIAGMIFFREPIMNFLGWAIEEIKKFWQGVFDYIYNERVKPWVDLWNNILKAPVTKFVDDMKKNMQNAWTSIMEWTDKNFVKRFQDLWVNITKSPETFKNTVTQWFIDLQNNIVKRWENVAAVLQRIWDNVTRYVGNGWRQMMDGIKNVLNDAIKLWNFIASKTQGLPKFAQLPLITQIGTPPESFARGGFVSQPTLAMLGDGANPNEYAIPEDMMPAAVAGWQAGLRGPALVTALQSSGLAPGSALPAATMTATMAGGGVGGAAVGGGGGVGPIQITVTGGTVTLPDGREMVTLAQAREIAIATVQAAAPGLVRASVQASGQLQRSAAGRSSYGLS